MGARPDRLRASRRRTAAKRPSVAPWRRVRELRPRIRALRTPVEQQQLPPRMPSWQDWLRKVPLRNRAQRQARLRSQAAAPKATPPMHRRARPPRSAATLLRPRPREALRAHATRASGVLEQVPTALRRPGAAPMKRVRAPQLRGRTASLQAAARERRAAAPSAPPLRRAAQRPILRPPRSRRAPLKSRALRRTPPMATRKE